MWNNTTRLVRTQISQVDILIYDWFYQFERQKATFNTIYGMLELFSNFWILSDLGAQKVF